MKWFCLILGLVFSCHAGGKSQRAVFSGQEYDTGRLEIIFPREVQHLSVTLNGRIVVRQANVESLLIAGIPSGHVDVVVSAHSVAASTRIWIDEGETSTLPIGVQGFPQKSAGLQLMYSMIAFVISQSINQWLFDR